MADIKVVLDWANSLCNQALTEAREGNTAFVNRVMANTALKLYFDNVHGTKTVKEHDFPFYYASQFKEITRLYESYIHEEKTAATIERVDSIESKLDNLAALVQQLVEAQKPAVVEPVVTEEVEAPKKGKKPAKTEVVESEVVAEEVEAETPAEEVESEA